MQRLVNFFILAEMLGGVGGVNEYKTLIAFIATIRSCLRIFMLLLRLKSNHIDWASLIKPSA